MSRKIQAHEARIHTATVEVKTLTISGRQVTLSVFRQLPKMDILSIDYSDISNVTATLRGVPWGTVNYYFDECKKEDPGEHVHVVWQDGCQLLRSCSLSGNDWSFQFYKRTGYEHSRECEKRLLKCIVDTDGWTRNMGGISWEVDNAVRNLRGAGLFAEYTKLWGGTAYQYSVNPEWVGALFEKVTAKNERERAIVAAVLPKVEAFFQTFKSMPQLYIAT